MRDPADAPHHRSRTERGGVADSMGEAVPATHLVDVGLGVGVATGLLVAAATRIGPQPPDPHPSIAAAVALAAVVAVAIALRRRYPVAALGALNAAAIGWFLLAQPGQLVALTPLIGCYTLAAQRGWRWGLAGAAPTALVQIVGIRVVLEDQTAGVVPIMVLLVATAGCAGAAVGYYRSLLAVTRAQLAREARTRDE